MTPTVSPAPSARSPDLVENGNFENGVVCPWQSNACNLAVVSGAMSVTERTQTWAGPRLDVTNKIEVGSSYYFQAEVRFPDADVDNSIGVKLKVDYIDSSLNPSYFSVAESYVVPNNQIFSLTGEFDMDASKLRSLDVKSIELYFQTPSRNGQSPTWDFEVDNISMINDGSSNA